MRKLSGLVFVIALLILSHTASPQPLDRETVLEKIIHAYGGEANLRKLDNAVQEWDMVALMGNRHGTDVRSIRNPNQLKVKLTYPEKTETRILNGEAGTVSLNGGPAQ